ncbi:MAG: zinc-binding dehydrogenase, partial [Anaerolineae bacterium]|nr:zinc-binding dehydrogenase [Anaerolineae bacterium]
QPLSLEEVEVPPLATGQVLVQVEAAGVCGSDVHMWRGRDPRTPLPIILGHEGVGRILELAGPKRDIYGRPLSEGDLVLWERGVTCGHCYYCAVLHEPSLCPERWVYGIHRSFDEPPRLNGCYASHLILDPKTPFISLEDVSDPALFVAASCSGATAAHGFSLLPAHLGDVVVVFGPGPLGAFSVALARAGGAEQVAIIGGTEERLALCQQLGATLALNRRKTTPEERRERILQLTQGRGADLVVEASGSVAAAREGLELLRPGGGLLLVGFGTPVGEMTLQPFEALVRKNVRVQGVWVSDVRHTLRAVSLIRQNMSGFAALVTHRFPLEEATQALEAVAARKAMKAVLLPSL